MDMQGKFPAVSERRQFESVVCQLVGKPLIGITFVLASVAAGAQIAHAQSPPPLAFPNLHLVTNGRVLAIAIGADGSTYFGGSFTDVNGVPRSNLAKLQADGSLDLAWSPVADGEVSSLAVSNDGVVAGGSFASVNGIECRHLAKVSSEAPGDVDTHWSCLRPDLVRALIADADGHVYVGGDFSAGVDGSGALLANLVRVSVADGLVDLAWNPSRDETYALALDQVGRLIAGGNGGYLSRISTGATATVDPQWNPVSAFSQSTALITAPSGDLFVGGVVCATPNADPCFAVAKIAAGTGAIDEGWSPTFFPAGSEPVQILALGIDPDGSLLAAGTAGETSVPFTAKVGVATPGVIDPTWNPSPDAPVRAIGVSAGDVVYLGGEFARLGTAVRHGLAGVAGDGSAVEGLTDTFLPGVVDAIAVQSDGRAVVGGNFTYTAVGKSWSNILRLQPDGSVDADWNPNADGPVRALAIGPEGSVYAGGKFTTIGGLPRHCVAKLSGTQSGAADPTWDLSLGFNLEGECVTAMARGVRDELFIGGNYFNVGLRKVSAYGTGAIDPDWIPLLPRSVSAIAVDADGAVFVAGDFFFFVLPADQYLVKLDPLGVGTPDLAWRPAPDGPVTAIAIDRDSNVFASGSFSSIGGRVQPRLAKIGPDGMAAASWAPDVQPLEPGSPFGGAQRISALALDVVHDTLYYSGAFSAINGQPVRSIAKLSSIDSGDFDASWNPSIVDSFLRPDDLPWLDWQPPVHALAVTAAGNILVGGSFPRIGWVQRYAIAALPPHAPPDQILSNGFD